MARHLIDVPPTLEKGLADMMHACVEPMVRVFDVVHHLFGVPAVGGCERLVPLGEDEALWVRCCVLRRGEMRRVSNE